MDRYQRVEKPRPETPINENEIRITAQGRMRNYITYATTLLQVFYQCFSICIRIILLIWNLGVYMIYEIFLRLSVFDIASTVLRILTYGMCYLKNMEELIVLRWLVTANVLG